MAKEYETKILEINVKEIKKKLKQIGAKKKAEYLMRRCIFDINLTRDEWIRLRDYNGKNATLTYKVRTGSGISETEEIEVHVSDFDIMAEILSKLKFKGKYYQENKREIYKLKDIEFCIDHWPKIPTYLEIEAKSEKRVHEGLKMLGLEGKDIGNISVKKVYSMYRIDLHSFKELRF